MTIGLVSVVRPQKLFGVLTHEPVTFTHSLKLSPRLLWHLKIRYQRCEFARRVYLIAPINRHIGQSDAPLPAGVVQRSGAKWCSLQIAKTLGFSTSTCAQEARNESIQFIPISGGFVFGVTPTNCLFIDAIEAGPRSITVGF